MNKATDPVLELLEETDLALPPKTIIVNLKRKLKAPPSRPTVFRALDDLLEYGYVERYPTAETHYLVTDKGREYLQGD